MRDPIAPKLSKWPFFFGDALLLALAYFIFSQSQRPMAVWEMLACVVCVAFGAWLGALPFLLEYRAVVRLAEAEGLTDVVSQIEHVEQLAAQIGYATNQWQVVRESADKTANMAKDIAQNMSAEVKSFNEFLQHANEGEKAALRLEVEKLRRGETEWLQVLVRLLDHVFALHRAALQSRQPDLIEQLGHFQNACRDTVRRVGLTPFIAAPAETFDERRHQLADANAKPDPGAAVQETLMAGYTFQGKLLRSAVVSLRNGNGVVHEEAARPNGISASEADQSQLPLGSAKPEV